MSPFERLRGAHLTGHPVLEDLVFSVLSVMILTVAMVAVFMPNQARVEIAHAAPKPSNPVMIVFYGSLVDDAGQPISGADVVVKSETGTVLASTTTDSLGDWSVRFKDERSMPKDYTFEITVYVNGQPVTGSTEMTAYTGMKWGLQLVFTQSSNWVFVPLPGY